MRYWRLALLRLIGTLVDGIEIVCSIAVFRFVQKVRCKVIGVGFCWGTPDKLLQQNSARRSVERTVETEGSLFPASKKF